MFLTRTLKLKHKNLNGFSLGFVIVNINCGQRPQRVEGANIDDYETVGPTSSPYADLQAAKPSIYADLTTTTNQCKQYAEIELKDIH